jgi:hypothetical protein
MTPWWCVVGALLGAIGLTLCAGACSAELPSANHGRSDSGADPGAAFEGGMLVIDSSVNPLGNTGLDDGGGQSGDGALEGAKNPHSDAAWTPAVPSDMPQVVGSGGPMLTTPVVQTITFSDYDLTSYVDDFAAKIGFTTYWHAAVSEYGIAPLTAAPPVHLGEAAPGYLEDAAVQSFLAAHVGSDPAWMAPTNQSLYMVFYPFSTTVSFQGLQTCFNVGAYHSSFVANGVTIPYVVVPECKQSDKTTLQTVTSAMSHELAEAVTDPLPLTTTMAYASVDLDHAFFQVILGGGEVADMCAQWPTSYVMTNGFPYMVQRTWSNAAAKAGHDPCQPITADAPFFNAVPRLLDTVQIIRRNSESTSTAGAKIAVGATSTVDVLLYSDQDVGPWTVTAQNVPVGSANLGFTWDSTTGQNGDVLHLTIHVEGVDPTFGGDPFMLQSTQGSTTYYWLGYVGQ